MFDLKDGSGASLFNTLRTGLSCQKCIDEGKAADCTHMQSVIPPWKSAAKFVSICCLSFHSFNLLTLSFLLFQGYGESHIWFT